MITPECEIKACQVFGLSIQPSQGPRAVSASVPGHVLEEAVALTDPQAKKISISSLRDLQPTPVQHTALQSIFSAHTTCDEGDPDVTAVY